jgi:hypothetical protein
MCILRIGIAVLLALEEIKEKDSVPRAMMPSQAVCTGPAVTDACKRSRECPSSG